MPRWLSISVALAALLAAPVVTAWEQVGPHRFTGVDRVIFVGDVHGALAEFRAVLRRAGVVDDADRWIAGDDHLVSVGDLLDRGDDSRAVMDLVRRLMAQAEKAGGKVHMVLGNHEIMNLAGDLGYVTPGEFASYADLAPEGGAGAAAEPGAAGRAGHARAFAPDGPYGAWLLSLPFGVVVNDHLVVHGGLSTLLDGMSLEAMNAQAHADLRALLSARRELVELGLTAPGASNAQVQEIALAVREDAGAPSGSRAAAEAFLAALDGLPIHPLGPTWNRRNAVCHRLYYEAVTERLLAQFGAERLVVGHTPTTGRTIQSRFDGQVLMVDTGMNAAYYDGRPAALVLANDALEALYVAGPARPVEAAPPRSWERPYGLGDEELERFLREAEIVAVEDLATGVTKPKRLTLRQGDRELRAVFKTFDTDPDLGPDRWSSRRGDIADRYVYDVVAYELDRLLGLHMVPPAVLREVDGREGVVQYWLENAINERDRQAESVAYRGHCAPRDQYNLMNVFDALINNVDRNLTNVLFTRPDWKLWLIDHSRAFGTDRDLPDYLREARFTLTPELRTVVEGIDDDSLAPLGEWLHRKQIRAIERRAKRLLRRAD